MPYTVRKIGNKFAIVKKDTGQIVGHSDSLRKAYVSIGYREKAMQEVKPVKVHAKGSRTRKKKKT